MNKLQFNRMATTVLFAVLVLVSSVALAQKPIKRPPKKVRQTTTQQVAKPPKKTVAPAKTPIIEVDSFCIVDLPTTGEINGHGWVDLGLSVKWAGTNVGAYSPPDLGYYFAWGETSPKKEAIDVKERCKTMGLDLPDISGNREYDAARANWGGSWRMPTKEECQELLGKCKWYWGSSVGRTPKEIIRGYYVVGPNGKYIFLPAFYHEKKDQMMGSYWSSSPDGSVHEAFALYFHDNEKSVFDESRGYGSFIRPVTE